MALRALHLCAGYGGFELALRGITRTVAHVERDAYAAATLVARMDETRLDQAPVWSDLTTFDAAAWRGSVDLITAGFPCQPFSAAGKRLGVDDDRWLWPAIVGIIRDVEPEYVFLENVPGVVRAGLAHVLSDLADLGFDAEWGLLAASAIGAPHRRERFWLVAHRDRNGLAKQRRQPEHDQDAGHNTDGWSGPNVAHRDEQGFGGQRIPVGGAQRGAEAQGCGTDVGHARGAGRSEVTRSAHGDEGPHGSEHADIADRASEDVADTEGTRCTSGCVQPRRDATQHAPPRGHHFPPCPDDTAGWQQWTGAQPSIRRSTDGATRWLADALHLGGNGLVPQCAREAWDQLTERLGR